MSTFFLEKNFAKPGDIVQIKWTCVTALSTFDTSDKNIAVVDSWSTINVVWVWEATITETTPITTCENTGWILLTSTEDWKPFFISPSDYKTFTNYELVFVCILLFVAFLIRFARNS